MAKAFKETMCTSCGDTIKTGAMITIEGNSILCFRCHPESRNSKVSIPVISGKEIIADNRPKRPFFLRRK